MSLCDYNDACVSAEDGWKQLTSLGSVEEEKKVVLSARPAELWDSEFDSAAFHSLLGFRGMQSAFTQQQRVI